MAKKSKKGTASSGTKRKHAGKAMRALGKKLGVHVSLPNAASVAAARAGKAATAPAAAPAPTTAAAPAPLSPGELAAVVAKRIGFGGAPAPTPTVAVIATAPAGVVGVAPPVLSDVAAPECAPELQARAAESRRTGAPMQPLPGHSFFVQRGIMYEEVDAPPAPVAAPAPTLSESLAKRPPAAPPAAQTKVATKSKPKAPAAPQPKAVGKPAAPGSGYGSKPGTAAALTKDLLMERPRTNEEVHEQLVASLGAAAAGPPKNVGWYRNWLKRHGHAVPTA